MNPINDFINASEDQILVFNKPKYWTSLDLVKKIKFTHKIKKIGHAGTLDPLAEGVLVVCTGKKTKEINGIQELPKTYVLEAILGATTDTLDSEYPPNNFLDLSSLERVVVESKSKNFVGKIKQKPPLYSALKIAGKRAYEFARTGFEEAKKLVNEREVEVYGLDITEFRKLSIFDSLKLQSESNPKFHGLYKMGNKYSAQERNTQEDVDKSFERLLAETESELKGVDIYKDSLVYIKAKVICSKGTYIRTLVDDLGKRFGSGGYLLSLVRTGVGQYEL